MELLKEASLEDLDKIDWLIKHPEYEEKPVSVEEFVNSEQYLNLKFRKTNGKWHGCRPRILKHLINIFDKGKNYNEFVFVCGIGWGKDFCASIILCYVMHLLACLKSPTRHYGLADGTTIYLMLMSINEQHARDVLFSEVKSRIVGSPWFKAKFMYDPKLFTVMKFPKNIMLIPGNSKDTSFVGYNIFCGIIDEGDDYLVTTERDSAEDGYNSIKDRITSRFQLDGMLGMIGSPKTVEGFMMRKYNNIEGVVGRYKVHVPTWDSLLGTDRLCGESFTYKGLEIPIEYKASFDADPERALRDLGARPALAKQPFITLLDRVNAMFPKKLEEGEELDERDKILFDVKEDGFSFSKFKEGIKGMGEKMYYGHLDLAVNRSKGDRLGFAVGHVEDYIQVDSMMKPVIRIDIAMVISAPPGGEILFSDVKQMLYYLHDRGFIFDLITLDSWQSIDIVQSLNSKGIKSDTLSMDRTIIPYSSYKDAIYEGRVKCHEYPLLANETKRLELVGGEKIDHPKGFSKDCADAVGGVVHNISESNSSTIINYTPSFGANREF